ncbi:hypothetical protein ECE50_000745 [Chitinophaga sp. Mgbs1]|uniref:Uncharacterized protein n=1 Tax=Chitinophaga solisilvae TaxID=1233460 RepID=A0A3S1AWM0_9BACT|nr:hypothetical protein [Chitinophaga solisilvae]
MNQPARIFFRAFVKPFYQENGGILVFIFTMMFFIVSQQSGAGLYEYHLFLVIGMLKSPAILIVVFLLWLLYTRKLSVFVTAQLRRQEYAFLHIIRHLSNRQQFSLFFFTVLWLQLPVWLYTVFIVITGWLYHYFTALIIVLAYLLVLCAGTAWLQAYRLNHPESRLLTAFRNRAWMPSSTYTGILLRFVFSRQMTTWMGIQLFTCILLYCIAVNNPLSDFDAPAVFIVFMLGILGNGVLVYRIREFEETYARFYRSMPAGWWQRAGQYAGAYLLLLLPVLLTLGILTPAHIPLKAALHFALCGYSTLLLMHGILLWQPYNRKAYTVILFLLFCLQYVFLMVSGLTILSVLCFAGSLLLQRYAYYHYERSM